MKTISPALLTYLNSLRPTNDAPLCTADLFTITLASGTILTYTNSDLPVAWNGYIFLANSILIDGLSYKSSVDLSVDKQQIVIAARSTDTLNGTPVLQTFVQEILDGAFIQRERAFFTNWTTNSAGNLVPIGTVVMFHGRVAQIDSVGRTRAKITVAADTCLLDISMPRRVWSPQCTHVLYDSGCTLAKGSYSTTGAAASGSTQAVIQWASATSAYQQGTIIFTSGANEGAQRTIKSATTGSLSLAYPLFNAPAVGDTFSVAQGCDHTMATCSSKFSNLANFRGYPFVPPPQIMTGPLSTSWNTNGGKG